MSRFDPGLSDAGRYPFTCIVPTRYGDLDTNKHINNVASVQMLEEGRIAFGMAAGYHNGMWPAHPVLAFHAIHYVEEGRYPGDMAVSIGVTRIGNSSWGLASVVYQCDRLCIVAEADLVMVNGRRAVPLSPDIAMRLKEHLLRAA